MARRVLRERGKAIVEEAQGLIEQALAPTSEQTAYKLFRTKDGDISELYPLFVGANESVPLNQWVAAQSGELTPGGKVKSSLGPLAYRPGWHAGDMPVATHIGGKSSPDVKQPDFRPADQVWAEVSMADDVDWQSVADANAQISKTTGLPVARTAQITDQVPYGGFYRYKTNPNMTGNWLIGGDMKVNRVLSSDEVYDINLQTGVQDLPPKLSAFTKKGNDYLQDILSQADQAVLPQKALDQGYNPAILRHVGPPGLLNYSLDAEATVNKAAPAGMYNYPTAKESDRYLARRMEQDPTLEQYETVTRGSKAFVIGFDKPTGAMKAQFIRELEEQSGKKYEDLLPHEKEYFDEKVTSFMRFGDVTSAPLSREAKNRVYTVGGADVLVRNGREIISLKPEQVRKVDAEFDPTKRSSTNFLASNPVAGLTTLAGGTAMAYNSGLFNSDYRAPPEVILQNYTIKDESPAEFVEIDGQRVNIGGDGLSPQEREQQFGIQGNPSHPAYSAELQGLNAKQKIDKIGFGEYYQTLAKLKDDVRQADIDGDYLALREAVATLRMYQTGRQLTLDEARYLGIDNPAFDTRRDVGSIEPAPFSIRTYYESALGEALNTAGMSDPYNTARDLSTVVDLSPLGIITALTDYDDAMRDNDSFGMAINGTATLLAMVPFVSKPVKDKIVKVVGKPGGDGALGKLFPEKVDGTWINPDAKALPDPELANIKTMVAEAKQSVVGPGGKKYVDSDINISLNTPKGIMDEASEVAEETASKGLIDQTPTSTGREGVGKSRERVGTTGQYIGGPAGVDSPEKLEAMIGSYINDVELGQAGADWYQDSSEYIQRASPEGGEQALADTLGITSQGTGVDSNLGFTVKAYTQRAAGRPIETGRFPGNQSPLIEDAMVGERSRLGPKRQPFADNLSVAWNPDQATTAVNDIWQGRAFGYTHPDGKPWDAGFSPQQHAFMDENMLVIQDRLNQMQMGGRTDWDNLNTQAAAWSGAKIRAGDIVGEDAATHYGDFADKYAVNATYEQAPGANTGQLEGLLSLPYQQRQEFEDVASWINTKGIDDLYSSGGLLAEPTETMVGAYTPQSTGILEINPGKVARPLVQTSEGEILPYAANLLDIGESSRAYIDVQNAGAYHRVIPDSQTKVAERTGIVVPLGESPTPEKMAELSALAEQYGFFAVDTGKGVNFISDIYTPIGAERTGSSLGKELKGELGQKLESLTGVDVYRAKIQTGYEDYESAWQAGQGSGAATKQFLDKLDENPTFAINIEPALQRKALANMSRDDAMNLPQREDVRTARRILVEKGIAGLRVALENKELLPVAVMGVLSPALISQMSSDDEQKSDGLLKEI